MKVFYIVILVLFLLFLSFYIFLSLRLSFASKKKEKLVRETWKQDDLVIVDEYKKATRVSLKEIFLGVDNGKTSK